MNKNMNKFVTIIALLIIVSSCKKTSNPNNEFEHEAITTLQLIFKNQQSMVVDTFEFDDPDGDGGSAPVKVDTIKINHDTVYQVQIVLLNKTKNPVKNVTPVIVEQGTSHELYFLPIGLNLQIDRTDKDAAGFPLGLQSLWQTNQPGQQGSVRIKLMHKPLVKGPNDSPSKGHADVDVYMPVTVK
jgi:hypothetical protein